MQENIPILKEVKPLKNYRLHVKFSDGVEGEVDLSEFTGKGVFALWNDYSQFERVSIGSSGELVWNEDVDIDGLGVYLKLTDKKPEPFFRDCAISPMPEISRFFGSASRCSLAIMSRRTSMLKLK